MSHRIHSNSALEFVQSSAPEVAAPYTRSGYAQSSAPEIVGPHLRPGYSRQPFPEAEKVPETPSTYRGHILGLPVQLFWIVVVLLVVVLVGGVAGGVAAGLVAQSQKGVAAPTTNSPSSTSPSSAVSTCSLPTPAALQPAGFTNSCNSSDGTSYTPGNPAAGRPYTINGTELSYRRHCYTNYADQSSGSNPQIGKKAEVEGLTSFEACITACAVWNSATSNAHDYPTFDHLCSGVVWTPWADPTRCDLNGGVTEDATPVSFDGGREVDSAVLNWNASATG